MQRALKVSESLEPPLMKPKASPNKVSPSATVQKDVTAPQKIDLISTQTTEADKKWDTPTPGAEQNKEEAKSQRDITQTSTTDVSVAKDSLDTITAPTKDKIAGSKVTTEVPTADVPPSKETTATISDLKDVTPQTPPAVKEVTEKKEEKATVVQKSAAQPVTPRDKEQLQQTPSKESFTDDKSPKKSAPPSTQPANQESGGFFGFGSPKAQRAASKTTEAVTGKMLGFGSSIFSSASTLITSAVQEESRTTPPSSRKMSAPAQVSGKIQTPQKSSPPVTPRKTSLKEEKPSAAKEPSPEKIPDQPKQTKVPQADKGKADTVQAAPKVGQPACPLCKAELNIGSKDPPNYNTCSECKTNVCSKCGFSPMPTATEVIQLLNA